MTALQRMMEAVSEAIENALGASLSDMLIQISATLILVLIIRHYFWDNVKDFIRKRKELMEEEFSSAKKANEEAKILQQKTDEEYKELKLKSKDLINKAVKRGEEEHEIIVSKAKKEAQDLLTQAELQIELEKKKARSSIQKEAVDLATMMASKIIEKEIDELEYQDLVTKNIESSENV